MKNHCMKILVLRNNIKIKQKRGKEKRTYMACI